MPWLLLSALIIGLDQWSKAWVLSSLPEYTAIPVVDGFWNWYRTYNTGAAFSFLGQCRWLAGAVLHRAGLRHLRPAGLVAVAHAAWRLAAGAAVLAGDRRRALGNVIDRLVHGHVVDFIQWYWRGHYWPSFNLADSAIVAGAIGIALFGLFDGRKGKAGS
ncbi:signal peptidase II [Pseudoxanthomonas sp. NC8]|nr:signal peptidase II [Pseudoxanthomonas sp. NC8]